MGAAERAIITPQMMMGLRWGCDGGVYVLLRFLGAMVGYEVCNFFWRFRPCWTVFWMLLEKVVLRHVS